MANQFNNPHRLVPPEGRIAVVTDAGRDAVDADSAADDSTRCGRPSRVVLTPRRWRQVGENKFSPVTVTKKPDRREEHGVSRKPLRGECRVFAGVT
jgi:hypothetical protein